MPWLVKLEAVCFAQFVFVEYDGSPEIMSHRNVHVHDPLSFLTTQPGFVEHDGSLDAEIQQDGLLEDKSHCESSMGGRRSSWAVPATVLTELVDKLSKVVTGLDEIVEPVVGCGPHPSPTAKGDHGEPWLTMWKTAVGKLIKVAKGMDETVEHLAGFGCYLSPGVNVKQDGFLQAKLLRNACTKEHRKEIVFRDKLTAELKPQETYGVTELRGNSTIEQSCKKRARKFCSSWMKSFTAQLT